MNEDVKFIRAGRFVSPEGVDLGPADEAEDTEEKKPAKKAPVKGE